MYNIYNNFQLKKETNRVKLSADSLIVLENIEDDNFISIQFPKCLFNIFESKVQTNNYDIYNVYTLNIDKPTRITDYKKIWKLGGFDSDGLYDNYYEGDNGRIYFGISKNYPQFQKSILMGTVSILIPKEEHLPFDSIYNIFAINKYDIYFNNDKQDFVLSNLQKLINRAIIINKLSTSLNIYGDNIDQKFDVSDLPFGDVVER